MDKMTIYFKDGRVKRIENMRDFYLSADEVNGENLLVIKWFDEYNTPVVSKLPIERIEMAAIK